MMRATVAAVVLGVTFAFILYAVNAVDKPRTAQRVVGANVALDLIDCQRPDYGGTDWLHDVGSCVIALRRYLEMHPYDPIVGVLAITGVTTDKLGVVTANHGYPAHDLVIEEICHRSEDGDCRALDWTRDTISWVMINDVKGLHSILKLRLRYGLTVPPPVTFPAESGAP